ncbi:hypothetical protein SCLCIDRAFT_146130, partial [Scleroderma citrinum Foug A]
IQCLSEWQNSFGSSALAMMLDFFSNLMMMSTFAQWPTMALAAVSSILFHFSILINCCQLEHAIKFVVDSTIDVEQVLKDMANNTDGKMKVKLLKVLNRAMGHVTSLAFQFLAMNWNSNTTAYQESIHK